jgi:hypothetical protein
MAFCVCVCASKCNCEVLDEIYVYVTFNVYLLYAKNHGKVAYQGHIRFLY